MASSEGVHFDQTEIEGWLSWPGRCREWWIEESIGTANQIRECRVRASASQRAKPGPTRDRRVRVPNSLTIQGFDRALDQGIATLIHHGEPAHPFLEQVQFERTADRARFVARAWVTAARFDCFRPARRFW